MTNDDTGPGGSATEPEWVPAHGGQTVLLTAVVNGMPTEIRPHADAQLRTVVQRALDATGNEGRPVDEWTVTNDFGRPLDTSRTIEELTIEQGDTIFVQVAVGAGG